MTAPRILVSRFSPVRVLGVALCASGMVADVTVGLAILRGASLWFLLLHLPAVAVWSEGLCTFDGRTIWQEARAIFVAMRRRHVATSGGSAHVAPSERGWNARTAATAALALVLFPGFGPVGCTAALSLAALPFMIRRRRPPPPIGVDVEDASAPIDAPANPLLDLTVQPLVDIVNASGSEQKRAAIRMLGQQLEHEAVHRSRGVASALHMEVAARTSLGSGISTFARQAGRRALVGNRKADMIAILLSLAGLAVWAHSLHKIDADRVTDLGLISVLPLEYYLALIALTVGFCVALSRRTINRFSVVLSVVVLILILYGTPCFVEDAPRVQALWKHIGVTDYIIRTGTINPEIDAYFNWPGFFILNAFLSDIAGLHGPLSYAAWAPLVLNFLYLGALFSIFRALSSDVRVVWLAIWFFYLADWIDQDYFSPQGFGFFLHLAMLMIVLRYFYTDRVRILALPRWCADSRLLRRVVARLFARVEYERLASEPVESWKQGSFVAIFLLLYIVSVASHQLSPVATLLAVTGLVVVGLCGRSGLPIIMLLILMLWLGYVTVAFLAGNLAGLLKEVGNLNAAATSNVEGRLSGSPGHLLVVHIRLLFSAAVWGLGGMGFLRRIARGSLDLETITLAISPVALLGLQSYGGEMILRVFLFSLPFFALSAARLFFPGRTTPVSLGLTIIIAATSVALMGGFLISRYGNEKLDHFTQQEVNATRFLDGVAGPNSLLVYPAGNIPIQFENYEKPYSETFLKTDVVKSDRIIDVASMMRQFKEENPELEAYLYISQSQDGELVLGGLAPGTIARFREAVGASGDFKMIYGNQDAAIFVLR